MIGCHIGRCFQVTVAGGSYQDGLTAVVQGHPPGMLLTEQEIYGDLLLRKPGADELSSPRKEPDLPSGHEPHAPPRPCVLRYIHEVRSR
jgi:chorismate synthase